MGCLFFSSLRVNCCARLVDIINALTLSNGRPKVPILLLVIRTLITRMVSLGRYLVTLFSGGEDGIVCVWKLSHLISTSYMYLGISTDDTFNSKTDPRYTFSDHSIQITDLYIGSGGLRARLFTASADKSCKVSMFSSQR